MAPSTRRAAAGQAAFLPVVFPTSLAARCRPLGAVSGRRLSSTAAGARRVRAAPRMGADARARADGADGADASPSIADDLRLLLDPRVSLSAKSTLMQDIAKRGPQRSKEALDEAFSAVGLDGVPAVAQQFTEDIVPDLARNAPRYVSELGARLPDALSDAAASVQSGQGPFLAPPPPPSADLFNSVGQELRNVFNRTPEGLETPAYEVVERKDGYEVRRYADMVVASAEMDSSMGEDTTELEAASAMGNSFSTLAKYLFGKNTEGSAMAMTTPVIIDRTGDYSGRMSFIMPSKFGTSAEAAPQPVSPVEVDVVVADRPGRLYAVREFTGFATAGEVRRQQSKLQSALISDGVQPSSEGEYSVLIYNGPSTLAFRRKNELCIPIESSSTPAAVVPDVEGYVEVGDTTD